LPRGWITTPTATTFRTSSSAASATPPITAR
jgi:hypothetical protein